jgi:crotonobetaine/carnitine-CoA ligase
MTAPLDEPGQMAVRDLLIRNAREAPDEVFVMFEDGSTWTRRQGLEQASAAAHELRRAGVTAGEPVAVAFPNGPDFLRAAWGTLLLGAIFVPVNTAYRGDILDHLMTLAQPRLVVSSADFSPRFNDTFRAMTPILDGTDLLGSDVSLPEIARPIENWDAHAYCLTSGTTGPSKLARMSYAHTASGGNVFMRGWGATAKDIYLADVAWYHSSGTYFLHSSLATRTRIAVRTRPSLATYWEVAKETGATIAQLMSTMVSYLEAQPVHPVEQEHSIRLVLCIPPPRDLEGFKRRFHIADVHTSWASTEVPAATCAWPGQPQLPGYCGRVRPGWQVRLVDENDNEVPEGEPGEAIVRSDQPWLMTTEYLGSPEATGRAWRNGWFHTGDMLRRDAGGNHFFVDRSKDALRRRGQNISSFEVERVVAEYPGVIEVACVPDRSAVDVEDEVKVWVVAAPGVSLDFADLLRHCADRLPHYMVPRYFELAAELPKTPSAKVRKFELRDRGNTAATWDRVQHGLDVTRHGLHAVTDGASAASVTSAPSCG